MTMHHIKLSFEIPADDCTMITVIKKLHANGCTDMLVDFTQLRQRILNVEVLRQGSSHERAEAKARDQVLFAFPGSRLIEKVKA